MSTASKPSLRIINRDDSELPLSKAEHDCLSDILVSWRNRRCGTQGFKETSHAREKSYVIQMVRFTQKAPWRWTSEDFDRWCADLGITRRLAKSTQRAAQGAVHAFLKFAIENTHFRIEVQERFGASLQQICNEDNLISHAYPREIAKERPSLSHEQVTIFFESLAKDIEAARNFGGKDFRPLQRDKAFFYTIYVAALRISEALSLNVNSFLPNAEMPAFGQFGRIQVRGKGSRGRGPKFREVYVDHPDLVAVLTWYKQSVRPAFLRNADPNEDALFLSEQGSRLGISNAEARFQKNLARSGLDGRGFTPHSLRHASLTHGTLLTSMGVQQLKAGHAFLSTTQIYTHLPADHVRKKIHRAIELQQAAATDAASADEEDHGQ